ncbi:hypothetical protein MHY1_02915 [Methylovirgula sp. HY1]|nr:hypothetical protein MHY1_02915 [Methylovirgula sp. HY1]
MQKQHTMSYVYFKYIIAISRNYFFVLQYNHMYIHMYIISPHLYIFYTLI